MRKDAAGHVAEHDERGDGRDIEVLLPDVDVEVADPDARERVTLTVREFRFLEGLEAQLEAAPLLADLAAVMDASGGAPAAADVQAAMGRHAALWIALAARACGREADWLARLSDSDGQAVSAAMWTANRDFFSERIAALAAPKPARPSRSAKSSRRSSGRATAGTGASSAS